MKKIEKTSVKKILIEIIGTIVGSFIMAVGVALFLLPNQLSSGGIAGIATITLFIKNTNGNCNNGNKYTSVLIFWI